MVFGANRSVEQGQRNRSGVNHKFTVCTVGGRCRLFRDLVGNHDKHFGADGIPYQHDGGVLALPSHGSQYGMDYDNRCHVEQHNKHLHERELYHIVSKRIDAPQRVIDAMKRAQEAMERIQMEAQAIQFGAMAALDVPHGWQWDGSGWVAGESGPMPDVVAKE